MPKTREMEMMKSKDGLVGINYLMLTKSNYTAWVLKMCVFMQAHRVWGAVGPTYLKAKIEDKSNKVVLAAIYQAIPEDILVSVTEKKTAKDACDTIKTLCLGTERVKKARVQTLNAEFEILSMKETETLDNFCIKLNGLVTNIRALGETVQCHVKFMVMALPPVTCQFHGHGANVSK